jgi:probable addiction module antidote protein
MKPKNKTSTSYEEGLLSRLKDPEYASEYLNAHLEDPFDPKAFLLALRDVTVAFGVADVASDTGLGRESLYKALSKTGNPKLTTLSSVLSAMGLKIQIAFEDQRSKTRLKRKNGKRSSAA